jgi:hypothetical protein
MTPLAEESAFRTHVPKDNWACIEPAQPITLMRIAAMRRDLALVLAIMILPTKMRFGRN